jgi:hypothetical protein
VFWPVSIRHSFGSDHSSSPAAGFMVSLARMRRSRRCWPSTRRGTADSAGGMAGWWLAGCEDGRGLAQRGGQAGQGAGPAATLHVPFKPGHGGQAGPSPSSEFGRGQAVLVALLPHAPSVHYDKPAARRVRDGAFMAWGRPSRVPWRVPPAARPGLR